MDKLIDAIVKAQNGNEEVKNKLVTDNLPLVWAIVHRYSSPYSDKEELFQIGCVGLIKAINKFDISYNVTLSTYAVPIIIGEIKKHYRDDGLVKVSRTIKDLAMKINKIKDDYYSKNHHEITVNELVNILNVDKEDIILAMGSIYYPASLNEVIYESDSNEIYLQDKIEDEEEHSLIDSITLKDALKKLTKKEKNLIYMRYFLDYKQDEIAKIYKISQVQVSRLEKKILEKMRKDFS